MIYETNPSSWRPSMVEEEVEETIVNSSFYLVRVFFFAVVVVSLFGCFGCLFARSSFCFGPFRFFLFYSSTTLSFPVEGLGSIAEDFDIDATKRWLRANGGRHHATRIESNRTKSFIRFAFPSIAV